MQTQAQVIGQGGMSNNVPQFTRSSFSSAKATMGSFWGSWQNEEDVILRREMLTHIMMTWNRLGLEGLLSGLANYLEEALYCNATSREEYADLSTLELRIHGLIMHIKNNQSFSQNGLHTATSLSKAIPSHNCKTAIAFGPSSSTSIVSMGTSGNLMSPIGGAGDIVHTGVSFGVGFGRNMLSAVHGQVASMGICGSQLGQNGQLKSGAMLAEGSHMMSIPGIPFISSSSVSALQSVNEATSSQLRQNQLVSGCQICEVTSGQRDANVSCKSHVKSSSLGISRLAQSNRFQLLEGGYTLMNSTSSFPNSAGYLGSRQQGTMQTHSQPINKLVPQMQYGTESDLFSQLVGKHDAVIATDRTGCGNLYNSLLSTGLATVSLGIGSLVSPPSDMIPISNLLSQQCNSQVLKNPTTHGFHQIGVQESSNFPMNIQWQHQSVKSQVKRNFVVPKDHAVEVQNSFVPNLSNSLSSQEKVECLIPNLHQPEMLEDQQSSFLLQKLQPQEQLLEWSSGDNLSHMEQEQHRDVEKSFVFESLPQEHGCQQQQCLYTISGKHADQNEQMCQETVHSALSMSNDTEQPEVASSNDRLQQRKANGSSGLSHAQQFRKQQCWLLFLRHVSRCTTPEGQCPAQHCDRGRRLWMHITSCHEQLCQYPQCLPSKKLLVHQRQCHDTSCPVCIPVHNLIRMQVARNKLSQEKAMSSVTFATGKNETGNIPGTLSTETRDGGGLPQAKRLKTEVSISDIPQELQQSQQSAIVIERQLQCYSQEASSTRQQIESCLSAKEHTENYVSNMLEGCRSGQVSVKSEPSTDLLPTIGFQLQGQTKVPFSDRMSKHKQEDLQVQSMKEVSNMGGSSSHAQMKQGSIFLQAKQESVASTSICSSDISPTSAKAGKMKIPGISYIEFFSPRQIKEHINSLRQWIGQSRVKAEKNQALGHQISCDACPACAVEKIYFDTRPVCCSSCGSRVKKNAVYHTTGTGENRHYFCMLCYSDIQNDTVQINGLTYSKSLLEKRRNDEQQEEAWVECDKCEKWLHQICALFNVRINDSERAEYTCPECCIAEMESGERTPYPQNAVLGAKDLPRTLLSDHIEERLSGRLEQERLDRARAMGKCPHEVPGAEDLIVRVVSSVDKKLDVKQPFLELFQSEGYPNEFLYKSKMILLFQTIEGVEVCLFGMYVQEFGAECFQPNQRRVYLAYLDSVKYFRPDVRTVNGEALRTFVYHEILIGYLDYCKKRGFTSCYIWACPPLKGEDYILYCHPEIQKTPKSDKLREWYLSMIRKAKKEKIVLANRNIYDYFFTTSGESKAKVTAARLPYFDGDYLHGAAEDIIMQLHDKGAAKYQRRGKFKKLSTKRSCRDSADAESSSNAFMDLQVMHKLGGTIFGMREDFIMVHMQHTCTHCREFINFGQRWVCQKCSDDFQLCHHCYMEEEKLNEEERHPAGKREWHSLHPVDVDELPADTRDRDEIIESEFFDTRQSFLSLCQGNHYQYDTLRRAKHSSMMVLYHLHNPSAPAFATSCNVCHHEIEAGQGWKCEICFDFDVCHTCYSNPEVQRHPHKLVQHPSCNAQNKEARQERLLQLQKMLELLVHATQCRQSSCQYAKCRNMKELFRHGVNCKTRVQGGCGLCKRMWYLLHAHARSCKEANCHIPRCMDLKEFSRRAKLQQESRRRAAVNEMMRQHAAESAAGNR